MPPFPDEYSIHLTSSHFKAKTHIIDPKNADTYNNRGITKPTVRALKSTRKDGKKPVGLRNKNADECDKNQ